MNIVHCFPKYRQDITELTKNTLVLSNSIQQTVGIRMGANCAPLL